MVTKTHPNSGLDLEDIIKENSPKLHSYVMSKVGNRDDANDIVQDTLYQFLRAVSIIDNPIEKVTSWLYKVAHNIIINHGKKHRKDDDYMQDVSKILMASDSESPEMKMLRRMVWDELDNALTELPSEQREAILLTEI